MVTREGAARLFLDPVVPTEQNSAAAALLKTDAALPVEILGISRFALLRRVEKFGLE